MVTDGRRSIEAPALPDCLDEVHDLIKGVAADAGIPEGAVVRFESAVIEVVANVVEHGAAAGAMQLAVTVTVSDGWLRGTVEDDGPALDVNLDAADMPDAMADRGRGLAMADQLLDQFTYERMDGANLWRMGLALN